MNGKIKNWIQENGIRLLLAFSALLYILSFFLPAYSIRLNLWGYECAYIAFGIAISTDININGGLFTQILTRGHFFLLGLHNIIVLACLFHFKKITAGYSRWLVNIFSFSILNTILFFFYNYFNDQMSSEPILTGYYVWVYASLAVLITLKWKGQAASIGNENEN